MTKQQINDDSPNFGKCARSLSLYEDIEYHQVCPEQLPEHLESKEARKKATLNSKKLIKKIYISKFV